MSTFERFAVEHPRARKYIVGGAALALAAYAAWGSRHDSRLAATCALAAVAGAGSLTLASRADRALYGSRSSAPARWARRVAHAAPAAAAAGVIILAPRTGTALELGVCAFCAGAFAAVTFLYPLPAVRRFDDRRAD